MTSLSEVSRGMCGDGFTTFTQKQLNDHENWYNTKCEMFSKMTKEEKDEYYKFTPTEKYTYDNNYIEKKKIEEEKKKIEEEEEENNKKQSSFNNCFKYLFNCFKYLFCCFYRK